MVSIFAAFRIFPASEVGLTSFFLFVAALLISISVCCAIIVVVPGVMVAVAFAGAFVDIVADEVDSVFTVEGVGLSVLRVVGVVVFCCWLLSVLKRQWLVQCW